MKKLICDFCGTTDSSKNPIISGDKACICQSCVTAAHDIMAGNEEVQENPQTENKEKVDTEILKQYFGAFWISSLDRLDNNHDGYVMSIYYNGQKYSIYRKVLA